MVLRCTISLPILWFEEKRKIRLFDILEEDFECQGTLQLGFPVGTANFRWKTYASQATNSC